MIKKRPTAYGSCEDMPYTSGSRTLAETARKPGNGATAHSIYGSCQDTPYSFGGSKSGSAIATSSESSPMPQIPASRTLH